MAKVPGRRAVARALAEAGCVAPWDEADEVLAAAALGVASCEEMVARRVEGEPLAWVTGMVGFAGHRLSIVPGVYVPRRQSEALARRAASLLPERGLAVDLCTGAGPLAVTMSRARPAATVWATDIDPLACRCAAANGATVFQGDMAGPLPGRARGSCDVVTAVVPYVPTGQLAYLPRDARQYEPALALDGGPDGARALRAAVGAAGHLLKAGGALLLELGGDQDRLMAPLLKAEGFGHVRFARDEEGDLRWAEAHRRNQP